MKTLRSAGLAVGIILLVTVSSQAQRKASTPEERTQAVQIARLLETDPFHKDAKKMRQWFTLWLIEVPDISVELCGSYLGPVGGSDKNYSADIFSQMAFSSAAFKIEHPDQANDRIAANLAGVEGSLKVYESILTTKPKAKSEFLDGLVEKRNKGELRAYVEEVTTAKCNNKKA
jgi:hypothetical protein